MDQVDPAPETAKLPSIELPASGSGELVSIQSRILVIVGANGSGKSRLGSWIELDSPQTSRAHRISAQRVLNIPKVTNTTTTESALNILLFGRNEASSEPWEFKRSGKWHGSPTTSMLSDYDALLVYLFTQDYELSSRFRQSTVDGNISAPPETILDIITRIWNRLLPHRKLTPTAGKLTVETVGLERRAEYPATDLSDGERVIIYLIGKCVVTPPGSILVIDEPESHIHRALHRALWDAIEAALPEHSFVYLTHDLDFAASRMDSTRIWMQSYFAGIWEWQVVPKLEPIPDQLTMQLIGSRQPILFCEGTESGLDARVYRQLYPDWHVVPVGGWDSVLQSTVSLSRHKDRHRLDCAGIVDRDGRTDADVAELSKLRVYCTPYSEIENMLLAEDVIAQVFRELLHEDPPSSVAEVKQIVLKALTQDRESVVARTVQRRMDQQIGAINTQSNTVTAVIEAWRETAAAVRLDDWVREASVDLDRILSTNDYAGALRAYSNKGLLHKAAGVARMKGDRFIDYICRLASIPKGAAFRSALARSAPQLPPIE